MPPPYFKSWQVLYAALESGPNFPTSLRIHVPDTIFFNDHKFPYAWYASFNYRLKKKYNDHLNIPRVCEELLKKSSSSSTFAFHFETYSEFLSKREFILRAKGWMHAETRHPTEIPWVLQVYTVPTMDKTAYLTSYLQPGKHPFSLVTSITAITHAERQKKQMEPLQFNSLSELQLHTYQAEIGGAKLSLRDPLFLRMKRLKLHLVSQVEKCRNITIVGSDNPTVRCLVCEFLNGPESGEVQLINVLGYHFKGRDPTWMVDISGNVYDKRIESFMAKKLNFQLYTEARTPRQSPYNRVAMRIRRRDNMKQKFDDVLASPEKDSRIETDENNTENLEKKKSILDDPEKLRRENAINAVFYKLYKDMKKKLQRPIDVFKRIDTDENGTISPKELRVGLLRDLGFVFTDEEFQTVIEIIDADGSGEIEYEELTKRIKDSDPERRERLKKQAMKREKLDNMRLKHKIGKSKGKRNAKRKTIVEFSKIVNKEDKNLRISDLRARETTKSEKKVTKPNLPSSFVPPTTDSNKAKESRRETKVSEIQRELSEKTALLQAAQKLVQDLQVALGQSLKHVPKPPKTQVKPTSNNESTTPLVSRITTGDKNSSQENSKLTLEIKRLSELLNNERSANLESLRRHDKESADLSAKIINLQNQLGEEKHRRAEIQAEHEKMKLKLQENASALTKLQNALHGRTNNALKIPISEALADSKMEENEEDLFDRDVLQYVASQNEPMFRWVFLTYADKREDAIDHVIQLEDIKRFISDSQIQSIDANKLTSLYLRSNGNKEFNMDFSHFVEFLVRLADDMYYRVEKAFSDRFSKFIAEHVVPLANMIIGDVVDEI